MRHLARNLVVSGQKRFLMGRRIGFLAIVVFTLIERSLSMASLPRPDKKIPFPIAHDDTGGSLFVYGSPQSVKLHNGKTNVIICCAGFPDDHRSFMPIASRLAKEEGCLAGVICLPGFDDLPEKPWKTHYRDGYTFNEMALAFKAGATSLLKEAVDSTDTKREDIDYTVLLHDWGVVVGMIQVNRAVEEEAELSKPSLSLVPNQVVLMDVGLPFHPKDNGRPKQRRLTFPDRTVPFWEACSEIYYRAYLAFTFFCQRYVSRVLAMLVLALGSLIMKVFRLSPIKAIDGKTLEDRKLDPFRFAYMCFPYFMAAKAVLTGKASTEIEEHATLPVLDDIPVLYMFGMDKNIQFHDNNLVDCLGKMEQQGSRSRAVAMEKGGHWFYLQQPVETFQHIHKFLFEGT